MLLGNCPIGIAVVRHLARVGLLGWWYHVLTDLDLLRNLLILLLRPITPRGAVVRTVAHKEIAHGKFQTVVLGLGRLWLQSLTDGRALAGGVCVTHGVGLIFAQLLLIESFIIIGHAPILRYHLIHSIIATRVSLIIIIFKLLRPLQNDHGLFWLRTFLQ